MKCMHLGQAIKSARNEKSLRDTADSCKISHTTLMTAEQGEAALRTSVEIAHALGLPRSYVVMLTHADVGDMISEVYK